MQINMYRTFYELQKIHWWFTSKKTIVLDTIKCHTNLNEESAILDIGCGSGLMLSALSELGQASGMDASDEAIQFSHEIFQGLISKGQLPSDVPFSKNQFDLITALDVIEHVEADEQSLEVIQSLLSDNGIAIITVPAYMFLWSHFDEMNHHKRRYTVSELKIKLQNSGLKIKKISYYNTFLFPIIYLVRKFNNLIGRDGNSDLAMPGKTTNFILSKILSSEKYPLRFLNFPFGVSILAVVGK
jgi:2-polyprenyl-3-methyl-5-hydroxy-6-metoxy-1,4-benzoquinol methylase